MTDNPFAALLAGVPRMAIPEQCKAPWAGEWIREDAVLAALARAMGPGDLVEQAGKVLEGVTGTAWVYRPGQYDDWGIVKEGDCVICQACHPERLASEVLSEWRAKGQDPWEANARFIAWCREGVPALLARLAAQEAQIKGLAMDVLASSGQAQEAYQAQVAAETALAAMTKERDLLQGTADEAKHLWAESEARVAKLVEEIKRLTEVIDSTADYLEENHQSQGKPYRWLRAAITEAGQ